MSELLKNLAFFGASGALLGTKSSFADTPTAAAPPAASARNLPASLLPPQTPPHEDDAFYLFLQKQ